MVGEENCLSLGCGVEFALEYQLKLLQVREVDKEEHNMA